MSESRDLVLDLWAAGKNRVEIATELRYDPPMVISVVSRARCAGDWRAHYRAAAN